MTDEQLIQLVESKTPEELSLEEIEALRDALAESPELQRVMAEQLSMEEYLSSALGRVNVSLDDIFAQARALQPTVFERVRARRWPVAAALLALLAGGFYLLSQDLSEFFPKAPTVAVAKDSATKEEQVPRPTSPPRKQPENESKPEEQASDAESQPSAETALDQSTSQPALPETEEPALAEEPAPTPPPWEAQNQLAGPVIPLRELGFPQLDPKEPLIVDDLQEWFTGIADSRPRMQRQQQGAVLQGLFKLQAPWPEGAVLRLNVASSTKMRLHFWHGQRGITLRYDQQKPDRNWSAYATSRDSEQPKPVASALAATDHGRSWRTGATAFQPIDIRYQNGELIMARGDLRLLSAPMAKAPEEIYFENVGHIRQIRMFRSEPLPNRPAPPRTVTLDGQIPSKLEWTTSLAEDAKFEKLESGAVRLTATQSTSLAWAATRLPAQGLQEILLEIENVQPGAGIYLGDASGKPIMGARIVDVVPTGQKLITLLPLVSRSAKFGSIPRESSAALVAERTWVRLICSSGKIKCWVSTDREHWGQVELPAGGVSGVATVGLACPQTGTEQGITLRRIEVRSLDGINRLVSKKLLAQASAVSEKDLDSWLAAVDASLPQSADAASWRHASAIQSLAAGLNYSLAAQLTRRLLEGGFDQRQTANQKLEFLDDMALVADMTHSYTDGVFWPDLGKYYDRLGLELLAEGDQQPFTRAGRRGLESSAWVTGQHPFLTDTLPQAELVALASARKWDAVLHLVQELREQRIKKADPLLDWLESWALRQQPDHRHGELAPLDPDTLHPLVAQISREGFNVLAELEVALANQSYKDACRIVSSSQTSNSFGLLPHSTDEDLWVSLPLTVAGAMQAHPMLLETMLEEYGPLGRLRIRQAIDQSNAAAVKDVTIQFYGTPAAALAHLWLGDRHLSSGDFARAQSHFRLASQSADPSLLLQITARERFTAAMMGHDTGQPIEDDVKIGDAQLTADQFESLIADLLKDRHKDSRPAFAVGGPQSPVAKVPRPAGMKSDSRVSFQANLFKGARALVQQRIDWAARQLGTATDEETLYVNNGVLLVALKHRGWKSLWKTDLSDRRSQNLTWPIVRMRPVLADERVLARGLTQYGPRLSCLDAPSGRLLWQSQTSNDQKVISDPLVQGNHVLALTGKELGRQMTVLLTTWDLKTGELRHERPVLQLERSWLQYGSSTLTTAGDSLIATLGGSVVCFNAEGQVRWLRRQFWLAPQLSPQSLAQHASEPFVLGDRIYVTQPGVTSIDCIDLINGRRVWTQPLPFVRRVLGHFEKNIIVETPQGFIALHAESGKVEWRHHVDGLLEARLCGTPGGLVYARRVETDRKKTWQPQLVWVDLSTGQPSGSTLLDKLPSPEPQLGPMFTVGDDLFVFAGFRQKDTSRRLFRLTPTGDADGVPVDLDRKRRW